MRIIEDFIPEGRRNRPSTSGHPKMVPRFITIHDTGDMRASAADEAKYIKTDACANRPASWHFTVDDRSIYQHIPTDEIAWHAGDGASGTGNSASIGIEICQNTNGNRALAERNAVELVRQLMIRYSIPIANVVQHNRWNGKNCPNILRGRAGGWEGFLAAIAMEPAGPSEVDELRAEVDRLTAELTGLKMRVKQATDLLLEVRGA